MSTTIDTQKTGLGKISIKDYIMNHEENGYLEKNLNLSSIC